MGELVEALVEREQPTHQEQDDRDHEGVHVAHPGVAELMRHIRGAAGALTTDQQKNLIATVCHGWIASDSIDEDPVSANATNLRPRSPDWRSARPGLPSPRPQYSRDQCAQRVPHDAARAMTARPSASTLQVGL